MHLKLNKENLKRNCSSFSGRFFSTKDWLQEWNREIRKLNTQCWIKIKNMSNVFDHKSLKEYKQNEGTQINFDDISKIYKHNMQ